MSVPSIYANDTFTILLNGKTFNIHKSDPVFKEVQEAIKMGSDPEVLTELLDKKKVIENWSSGNIKIVDGEVYLNDELVDNYITNKIIEMYTEGFNINPMVNFYKNLMENPSMRAVNELYKFLEYGKMPITEDGYFLAYKKVKTRDGVLYDVHSGKIVNDVGSKPSMPRNQVNENPNETCSFGLHFCSKEYLQSFGGDTIVVVKIHPKNVVAIPIDYNNTKGRCCEYEVIDILKDDSKHFEKSVYVTPEPPIWEENDNYYSSDDSWENSSWDEEPEESKKITWTWN